MTSMKFRAWTPLGVSLALAFAGLASSPAQAQWMGDGWEIPQGRIERRIQASGYDLLRPVQRRHDVYLADVERPEGGLERLVIDTRSGELLQRFRVRPVAPVYRPTYSTLSSWFADPFDQAAPRPPGRIEGRIRNFDLAPPPDPEAASPRRLRIAKADPGDNSVDQTPRARPRAAELEQPAPIGKPRTVKRRVVEPTAARRPIEPSAAPASAALTRPRSIAAPTEDVIAQPRAPLPIIETPQESARPTESAPSTAVAKAPPEPVAAKAPEPATPVQSAANAAPAFTPVAKKSSLRKKPLNDLPVAPLE